MNIARTGKRVIFESAAIARDVIFSEKGKEFSRKVRTLTGNYQLLRLAPWLLSPANPLLFRFISHKLLRLLVPLLLLLMLVASGLAEGPFLPRDLLAPDSLLRFGCIRFVRPVHQEVQAGRTRNHLRYAECSGGGCLLQFCNRTQQGLGSISVYRTEAKDSDSWEQA